MLLFTKYKCTWPNRYQHVTSRCITCAFKSHATKRLPPQ